MTMPHRLNRTARILIVDDQRDTFDLLSIAARHCALCASAEASVEFDYAETPEEAVQLINQRCYDACILDIRLRGFNGLNLGDLIREHDANIPLAYLTGFDTPEVRAEALRQRAFFWRKERFQNPHELLLLARELASLNPCADGGERVDNHGFKRRLPETPIEIPDVLQMLIEYSTLKASAVRVG
jgi:DNA-binding NtrC family response regulator